MRKFIEWLERFVPTVWAILLTFSITAILLGSTVSLARWLLSLLGVV